MVKVVSRLLLKVLVETNQFQALPHDKHSVHKAGYEFLL